MTFGRLTDRLLSVLVPRATAVAAMQSRCFVCTGTRSKICYRDCIQGVCEPWGACTGCGAC